MPPRPLEPDEDLGWDDSGPLPMGNPPPSTEAVVRPAPAVPSQVTGRTPPAPPVGPGDPALSLPAARAVIWQGSGPRQPMGTLLNAGLITARDLAWAAERAYSAQVRAAARTLLADWLAGLAAVGSLPAPGTATAPTAESLRYGPEVINGSRYLVEQAEDTTLQGAAAGGVGIASLLWVLQILLSSAVTAAGKGVFALQGTIWVIGSVAVALYYFRRAFRYGGGRQGEDAVVDGLRTALDHRWTVFRNLQLPGSKADLDLVLVGPGGVWVVEVKAYTPPHRIQHGVWQIRRRGSWQPARENPVVQVQGNARRLRHFLQTGGVNVRWVDAAIALARPQPVENFLGAHPPVWLLPTLERQVGQLRPGQPIPPADLVTIVGLLRRQADQQRARERSR